MKNLFDKNELSNKGLKTMRKKFDHLFWREVNTCLVSSCDCFSVMFDTKVSWDRVSYNATSAAHETDISNKHLPCDKCVVQMPTGILSVNTSLSVDRRRQTPGSVDCSMALLWTSKESNLTIFSDLLQQAQSIKVLPIHVDLLPVLELINCKRSGFKSKLVHDCFLVPKHCIVRGGEEEWRKSSCMAEIAYITKRMSKTHKKCYKIMKYILSVVGKHSLFINWYHVKTTVMNHSRKCVDPSKSCAGCVMKMLTELKDVYESKELKSFHLGVDLYDMFKYRHEKYPMLVKLCIGRLYSVTDTETCLTLVQKLQRAMEHEWIPETRTNKLVSPFRSGASLDLTGFDLDIDIR